VSRHSPPFVPYSHEQKKEITLCVRLYRDGAISKLLAGLKVGDEVDVSGPFDGAC
jgi:NAD(P)H-flavin reductase